MSELSARIVERLRRDPEVRYRPLARELGCTHVYVRQIARSLGIPPRRNTGRPPTREPRDRRKVPYAGAE